MVVICPLPYNNFLLCFFLLQLRKFSVSFSYRDQASDREATFCGTSVTSRFFFFARAFMMMIFFRRRSSIAGIEGVSTPAWSLHYCRTTWLRPSWIRYVSSWKIKEFLPYQRHFQSSLSGPWRIPRWSTDSSNHSSIIDIHIIPAINRSSLSY